MLEGFLFYYNFVSADSWGFARRGGTRSSEGRFPSSRSSPPATGNGLLLALRAKRLRRLKFYMPQPSVPNGGGS